MTNNVNHRVYLSGNKDELNRFRETCFREGDGNIEFDFNALISMPEILNNTLPENTSDTNTVKYQAIEAQAIKQCGYKSWYEWRRVRWGTKWNAYQTYVQDLSDEIMLLEFDTAWSCPEPIFDKLAEFFPTLDCHGVALDECCCFGAEVIISMGDFHIEYDMDVSPNFIDKID